MFLDALRQRLLTGPNQIALSSALRGTIATVLPLALLPLLGFGTSAPPVVFGALNTAIADAGGSYRSRLAVMGASALIGPWLMLLGMLTSRHWWLAGAAMLAIALVSGLVRGLGPSGTALGLNTAVAFLIGLQLAGDAAAPELDWVAGYAAGGLWTILVTLAFWELRPYRRLEQEVASAWEAVAGLVAAARPEADTSAGVVARRRREQRVATLHRAARETIERARTALGEVRAATHGPGTTIAHLLVLLRAASRIDAAAVTLAEVERPARPRDATTEPALAEVVDEIERACRAAARVLLLGRGVFDVAEVRQRFAAFTAAAERAQAAGSRASEPEVLALAQAVRQLNNAEETVPALFGRTGRLRRLILPSLASGSAMRAALLSLRIQLTPRSAIFRHAWRVAVVAAAGTALIVRLDLPHGFWLPMTALVILQPDYGSTLSRALQRTAGTMAGAVLASALLVLLRGTAAFDASIALLLFAMFLLLRRRYGLGVTFLTPLVLLLISPNSTSPWRDLILRLVDTLAGAGLALGAGYLLWPLWEREQLPRRLARAIGAGRDYLGAVLDGLADNAVPAQRLVDLRLEAEIEAANADAAFQRMLAEPRHQRGSIAQGFALDTYIQRLTRHSLALAGHLGAATVPAEPALALRRLLTEALSDLGAALVEARPPQPRPAFDQPLERLREALMHRGDEVGATIAFLLGQIVGDTTSLHAAVDVT